MDAVLKGWGMPTALACAGLAFLLAVPMKQASAQVGATVVSAVEQASRDDERLRILRDELRKSEALVESLAKRRSERLAVADPVAAQEADDERLRALSDIAGLKREIAATRPSDETAGATPAARPAGTTTPRPKPGPTTPWWDVYGKARRGDTAAAHSSLQPPGPAAAQANMTRRME